MKYLIKMYKMLTIYYRDYKKFIMTKEDFVKSRFIVLFLFKMLFVLVLIWKVFDYDFGITEKGNYTLHIVFVLIFIIINQIANKCQKKINDIELGLTKVEVESYVRVWQLLTFSSVFIFYLFIVIIGE